MLRDSYHAPDSGHHVEQVEMVFSRDWMPERISAAWEATVAATEILRTCFEFTHGIPTGCDLTGGFPIVEMADVEPASWETWREADRCRPLLFPDRVPWRIVYWPQARTLVWTFHHALLDGRSISRIVRAFLDRLAGNETGELTRSKWHPPSRESVAFATDRYLAMSDCPAPAEFGLPAESASAGPAAASLGREFLIALETIATGLGSTVATLITWAWGQALAELTGRDPVMVEQIRAGAPQPGTAGFTMNVLPLWIRKSSMAELPVFQAELLALRRMESVSPSDFPSGIHPETDGQDTSAIMVERATFRHAVGHFDLLESLALHERKADSTLATAHLLPDLRLEVEGPHRHALLAAWIDVLMELERGIHPA